MYRKCTMILQNDPLFENDNITVTHERHLGLWDLNWEIFIGPDHIVYPIADKLTNPLALTNALELDVCDGYLVQVEDLTWVL